MLKRIFPFPRRYFSSQHLKWTDHEEIAESLFDKNPKLDPLSLRFTKLHELVTKLESFKDDPEESSESKLEKIQMTWYELYEENSKN